LCEKKKKFSQPAPESILLEKSTLTPEQVRSESKNRAQRLELRSQKILNRILISDMDIPRKFVELFVFIRSKVEQKFSLVNSQISLNVVGGIFFLRFIIPAIIHPESYGLVNSEFNFLKK
jgi:hypothetical protein